MVQTSVKERRKMDCEKCNTRFAEGFLRGRESVLRKNKSGCCCIIDDNDVVISVCGAHQELIEEALKKNCDDDLE